MGGNCSSERQVDVLMTHEWVRSVSEKAHIWLCGRQLQHKGPRHCCKIALSLKTIQTKPEDSEPGSGPSGRADLDQRRQFGGALRNAVRAAGFEQPKGLLISRSV